MYQKTILLVYALIFSCASAFGQPPNDNCFNATPLSCAVSNGTNVGATTGTDDSYAAADICAFSLENTVWFSYTATATGTVDVNVSNINCGSGFGLQFGVFTGPCNGPYTPVGTCVSGYPPPPLSFPAVNGQNYFIVIDGDAGDQCSWDMNICPPGCAADAGTVSTTINGAATTSPIVLCPGDCYAINSNNDYVLPTPVVGEVSELMFAIYTCAPPANPDITVDACYSGFLWTGQDFNDCHDATSILLGAGLGPQVWYIPVTADDSDNNGNPNGVINVDNNGDGCYDYGAPIEITYTNPITFSATENCSAGTVSVTISGGSSEFYGGNYNVTNTGSGTVTGLPVQHGGSVTITGLLDGQSYSFTVTDQYGCTYNFAGGPFVGPDDPTITPAGPFCESDAAVNLGAATGGGTWSGTGITNGVAGTFNPATAGPGSHVITYTLNLPCLATDTETIVVNPDADATITAAGPFCANDPAINLVAADPGGTWSGTGITNAATGTFDPATAGIGTHTITYSIPNPCGDTQNINITVNATADATITPAGPFCPGDPAINLSGATAGGTWSGTGITNAAAGTFDPSVAGAGTHTITYTIANPCGDTQTFDVVVNNNFDATITPAGPFCANDAAVNLVGADAGGVWSGTGITDANAGTFDPTTAGAGTHTITYTIGGSCGDVQNMNITVNPNQDATITPVGPFCPTDPAINMTGADPGGTWSGTGITNAAAGTFDPVTAGTGTHTITYTLANPCGDTQTFDVLVNATLDATITPAGPFCESDAPVNLVGADPGGTWSGTGITDANAGTFNPTTAGAGTHTITYTIAGSCGDVQTYDITVNSDQDATITPVGPFCPNDAAINLVGADPGGTWSGTGITNAVAGTFDPTTAGTGTHTITYTLANPCGDTQTFDIVVNTTFDATITPAGPYCESDAAVNLTAADAGGTWSGTGITDANAGTFDPNIAGPGTHTITYTISGSCGDTQTYDIVVNPNADATITAQAPLCASDPSVNLTGATAGGVWSGTGITDANLGTFDPGIAGVGTHTITYNVAGPCPDIQTIDIIVSNQLDATITPVNPFCTSNPSVNLVGADPGGTWSGTGITDVNAGTFDPGVAGAGTHTITYTLGGSCGDVQTLDILVILDADATITQVGPYCTTDPQVTLTAVDAGGVWSGTGITDANLGTFDPATAGTGTHTITYTINGACGDVSTIDIVVSDQLDASITAVGPYCENDLSVILVGADAGGTWSGTGITNSGTGEFDPGTAGVGTHTITYTLGGNCGDVQTTNITILPNLSAAINPVGPYCVGNAPVTLTGTDPGGTWSGNGITDPVAGTFDPAVAGVGTHTITYTIAGQCGDSRTYDIVVIPNDDATITQVGPFCADAPAIILTAATGGGTWSGNGITGAGTGAFDPAVAGAGTHTITYDIAGPCGNTATIDIIVDPVPVINFTADVTTGCVPLTVTFTDLSIPAGTTCSWDFGDGTTSNACGVVTHTYTGTNCYPVTLTITTAQGCTNSLTINDMICPSGYPTADFDFGPQPTTVLEPTINFTNLSLNATSYEWDFAGLGTSTQENPSFVFPDSAAFYDVCLIASSDGGCTDTICQVIEIGEEFSIYVPNAFTPDNDGVNDIFLPMMKGVDDSDYTLLIFNRWGELIAESYHPDVGWDGISKGLNCKQDVYVWKILVKTSGMGDKKEYVGHVTLLR